LLEESSYRSKFLEESSSPMLIVRRKFLVDVTTLKMARKPVKIQRKVQQDVLGKVNREKEIRRKE